MLAIIGVPETTPVVGLRISPAGRAPDVIVQVYGGYPPDACSVVVYGVPTIAVGSGLTLVMDKGLGAAIWIINA